MTRGAISASTSFVVSVRATSRGTELVASVGTSVGSRLISSTRSKLSRLRKNAKTFLSGNVGPSAGPYVFRPKGYSRFCGTPTGNQKKSIAPMNVAESRSVLKRECCLRSTMKRRMAAAAPASTSPKPWMMRYDASDHISASAFTTALYDAFSAPHEKTAHRSEPFFGECDVHAYLHALRAPHLMLVIAPSVRSTSANLSTHPTTGINPTMK